MAVVRRRPVPTTKDIQVRSNLEEEENQTDSKDIQEKPRKTIEERMQERREVLEKLRLETEIYSQEEREELSKEANINDNQDTMQEYKLENFTASTSKTISKISIEAGVMSVINSKNCRRITLAKDVMSELNNPKSISISFSDDRLAVAERLPNNDNLLKVKSSGNKGVIYSSGLVSEITDKYGLDFSNRVSITFSEVKYIKNNGYTVAIIRIR